MEDFIASEWQFCIKLDYNKSIAKSAEKIIEKAESCVEWYGNQDLDDALEVYAGADVQWSWFKTAAERNRKLKEISND